jgi:hypothetical protein
MGTAFLLELNIKTVDILFLVVFYDDIYLYLDEIP